MNLWREHYGHAGGRVRYRNLLGNTGFKHGALRSGAFGTGVKKTLAVVSIAGMALLGAAPALAEGAATDQQAGTSQSTTEQSQSTDGSTAATSASTTPPAAEPPAEEPPAAEPPAEEPPAAEPPAEEHPAADPPASDTEETTEPVKIESISEAPNASDVVDPAQEKKTDKTAAESEDAVPQPPFLRWTTYNESGAPVTTARVTLDALTSGAVPSADDDQGWAAAISMIIADNIGQEGYTGADLDPAAGAFLVSEVIDDADQSRTPSEVQATGSAYRVSGVLESGDVAEWTLLPVTMTETEAVPRLTFAAAKTEEADDTADTSESKSESSQQRTLGVGALNAPVGAEAVGGYENLKDNSNTVTWSWKTPDTASQSSQFNPNTFQTSVSGSNLLIEFQRPSATGSDSWAIEYTKAGERWGNPNGLGLVPQPDRSQGGQVIFIGRNGTSSPYVVQYCTYSSNSYLSNLNNCITLSNVLVSTGTTVSLRIPLSSIQQGSPGCPPTMGSTAYVRSFNNNNAPSANLMNWAAPVAFTPASNCGNTTLKITKIGDRTGPGTSDATRVNGATFVAYASTTGNPGSPTSTELGTCVTANDGTCTIVVSNANSTGVWVQETGVPTGWRAIPALGTGNYTSAKTATPYRFKVNITANSTNVTKNITADRNSPSTDVSGAWVNARVNPAFPSDCGVSIAMVFDTSASIDTNEMTSFKNAARLFVGTGGLGGTPSTVTMFRFDTNAQTMNGGNFYNLATQGSAGSNSGWAGAQNQITTGLPSSGNGSGYTNWDAALRKVQESGTYDLVVFLTDGDPTTYGANGSGNTNTNVQFRSVEQAVLSANAIKASGSKIVGVGVGLSTNSDLNLQAITGPTAGNDYFLAGDFDELQSTLHDLALQNCGGTISVVKQLQNEKGELTSESASGWTFTATGDTVDGSPASETTTASGANFDLSFTDVATHNVVISETTQADYTFVSAVCTDTAGTVSVDVTNAKFTVPVTQGLITKCTVVNRAVPKAATLSVTKAWLVEDSLGNVIYDSAGNTGTLPNGISAELALSGENGPITGAWGDTVEGLVDGDLVTIGEDSSIAGLPGCTQQSSVVTVEDGEVATVPLAADGNEYTMHAGANVYEITNTVQCTTTLVLLKTVEGGGSGVPANWNLTATGLTVTEEVAGAAAKSADNTIEVRAGEPMTLSEAFAAGGESLAYNFDRLEVCTATDVSGCTTWATVSDPSAAITVDLGQEQMYRFVNALAPAIAVPLTGGVAGDLFGGFGLSVAAVAALLGTGLWLRSRRIRAEL